MALNNGVFVSYRRDQNAFAAQLISSRLKEMFGRGAVFLDVEKMRAGRDFVKVLDEQLEKCDALLAIIGKDWCSLLNKEGQRRLDAPNDWVRIEIEQALKRKAFVLPVLVDDASMPTVDELPPSIQKIANLENVEIRTRHLEFYVDNLIKVLIEALGERAKARLVEAENARSASEKGLRELEAIRRLNIKLAEQAKRRQLKEAARLAEEQRKQAEATRIAEAKRQKEEARAAALAEKQRAREERESAQSSTAGNAKPIWSFQKIAICAIAALILLSIVFILSNHQ